MKTLKTILATLSILVALLVSSCHKDTNEDLGIPAKKDTTKTVVPAVLPVNNVAVDSTGKFICNGQSTTFAKFLNLNPSLTKSASTISSDFTNDLCPFFYTVFKMVNGSDTLINIFRIDLQRGKSQPNYYTTFVLTIQKSMLQASKPIANIYSTPGRDFVVNNNTISITTDPRTSSDSIKYSLKVVSVDTSKISFKAVLNSSKDTLMFFYVKDNAGMNEVAKAMTIDQLVSYSNSCKVIVSTPLFYKNQELTNSWKWDIVNNTINSTGGPSQYTF